MWFAPEVAPSTNLLKTLRIDEVFKDFCKLQTVKTRLSMDEILNKHVKVFMIITHQYLKDENFSDVRRDSRWRKLPFGQCSGLVLPHKVNRLYFPLRYLCSPRKMMPQIFAMCMKGWLFLLKGLAREWEKRPRHIFLDSSQVFAEILFSIAPGITYTHIQ